MNRAVAVASLNYSNLILVGYVLLYLQYVVGPDRLNNTIS